MQRRSFLQALAASVTSFATPTRVTASEDGGVIYVFHVPGSGIHGFEVMVPAEGWCLAIFVPSSPVGLRVQYVSAHIERGRVLLDNAEFTMPIDASALDGEPHPTSLPVFTAADPLYFRTRSLSGEKASLPLILFCDEVSENAHLPPVLNEP